MTTAGLLRHRQTKGAATDRSDLWEGDACPLLCRLCPSHVFPPRPCIFARSKKDSRNGADLFENSRRGPLRLVLPSMV